MAAKNICVCVYILAKLTLPLNDDGGRYREVLRVTALPQEDMLQKETRSLDEVRGKHSQRLGGIPRQGGRPL